MKYADVKRKFSKRIADSYMVTSGNKIAKQLGLDKDVVYRIIKGLCLTRNRKEAAQLNATITTPYDRRGKNNPKWNGGVIKRAGYRYVYAPNHPFAMQKHVLEHRLVMEVHLKRYLTKEEVVHHINFIKTDNRLENLMFFPNQSAHINYHHKLRKEAKIKWQLMKQQNIQKQLNNQIA